MEPSTLHTLDRLADSAWLYVAGPLLALAAVTLSIRLRLPQVARLGEAFRSLRADPQAEGSTSPGLATTLEAVGAFGAAAAVGAGTAVALGGAGAIGWVWLFGFLLAPLRFAETLLARTDVPGGGEASASGSLAARLVRDRSAAVRVVGWALVGLVGAVALGFIGGVHGAALGDAARGLLPDSVPWLLGGVAIVGALLAVAGAARTASIAGWLGLLGLVALVGPALWAAASEPGRAFATLGRAVGEAFQGAPTASHFGGAFAGEVAFAAMLHVLPPFASTTGTAGALHGLARARSTRAQAAASLLGPLAFAAVTTVVGMALIGTGAFYERTDTERPVSELRFYRLSFQTASQRIEPERVHEGHVRIRDGKLLDKPIDLATERGMVHAPRFVYYGRPANVALRIEDGRVIRMLRPVGLNGALIEVSPWNLRQLVARGEMLPKGGPLVQTALSNGTGTDLAGRLALAGLLALLAAAAGVWGFAAARAVPLAPPWARLLLSLLPAAGVALHLFGQGPWLEPAGGLAAAGLVTVAAVGLLLRSDQAARLARRG